MKQVYLTLGVALLLCNISCNKHQDLTSAHTFSHEVDGQAVSQIYIPAAFTPNGDGINDTFGPFASGFDNNSIVFKVYSKNQLIFTGQSTNQFWQGYLNENTLAKSGVYLWTLEATDTTGHNYSVNGSVTLAR